MQKRPAVSAVLAAIAVAALAASACDDNDRAPTQPTSVTVVQRGAMAITVQPVPLLRRPVPGAFCPLTQPFVVPFDLLLRSSDSGLTFLDSVRLQFTDSFGVQMPPVTFAAPQLNSRFATLQIPPLGVRAFPFAFDFGCGTGPVGSLLLTIGTRDGLGRTHTGDVTVLVQ